MFSEEEEEVEAAETGGRRADAAVDRGEEEEEEEEDGYFSSYTHFAIHEEMLKVRVQQGTGACMSILRLAEPPHSTVSALSSQHALYIQCTCTCPYTKRKLYIPRRGTRMII